MKKILKWLTILILAIALAVGATSLWYNNINHAFRVVTEDHVYKSGLIPPSQLEDVLLPRKIKTVIDFLDPGVQNALNPAKQEEIDAEAAKIAEINKEHNLHINHINIPSPQVPNARTLKAFYKVIDNPKNYPILMHCYHGTGRAEMYSAIYRIEKEGWTNKQAQEKTRPLKVLVDSPLHHSSFSKGRGKGDFLLNYNPRRTGESSTINQLEIRTDER